MRVRLSYLSERVKHSKIHLYRTPPPNCWDCLASEIIPLQIPPSPSRPPLGPTHYETTLKWVWCCCQTECWEHPSSDLLAGASLIQQSTSRPTTRAFYYWCSVKQQSHYWQCCIKANIKSHIWDLTGVSVDASSSGAEQHGTAALRVIIVSYLLPFSDK